MRILDATRDLTAELLSRNLAHWSDTLGCGNLGNLDSSPASRVLVTHTFPREKVWVSGFRDLCREILEEGEGLLSDYSRENRHLYAVGEPRPRMPQARAVGLNHFVFAYLGVHDPFYSRAPAGVPMPAFGLFVRRQLETFPYCNVTRRDLASFESNFKNDPESDFLDSSGARRLCNCQVAKDPRHKQDFWHYWGAPEFWVADPKFEEEHWKSVFEFHFREKISVDGFEAILWPDEPAASSFGTCRLPSWHARAEEFRRSHPSCQLIFYEWDWRKPRESLLNASTAVTKYFLQKGEFPPLASDALELFPSA